jgi:DNA ligase-1
MAGTALRRSPRGTAVASRAGTTQVPGRIAGLDALRGLALLAMIAYHFCFDLRWFGLRGFDFERDLRWIAARSIILGTFLFVAGVSLALSAQRPDLPRRFARQVARVAAAALLVSAATYVAFPQRYIWFGVLHAIAVSLVLRVSARAAAAERRRDRRRRHRGRRAAFAPLFDSRALGWIGFMTYKPPTEDTCRCFRGQACCSIGVAADTCWCARRRGALEPLAGLPRQSRAGPSQPARIPRAPAAARWADCSGCGDPSLTVMRRLSTPTCIIALDASTEDDAKIGALTAYFARHRRTTAAVGDVLPHGPQAQAHRRHARPRDRSARRVDGAAMAVRSELRRGGRSRRNGFLCCCRRPTAHDGRSPLGRGEIAPLAGLLRPRFRHAFARVGPLDRDERFVFASFSPALSRGRGAATRVPRAAQVHGLPVADVAHRLIGEWSPSPAFVEWLHGPRATVPPAHRPYPFFLAALRCRTRRRRWAPSRTGRPSGNGTASARSSSCARTARACGRAARSSSARRSPRSSMPRRALPAGTVIDGELLAWADAADARCRSPRCSSVSTASARPRAAARRARGAARVRLARGSRRGHRARCRCASAAQRLEALLPLPPRSLLSPRIDAVRLDGDRAARSAPRERRAEGVMLKRRDSRVRRRSRARAVVEMEDRSRIRSTPCSSTRSPGSGRRASLLTDYTFACRDDDGELVPFAKAYSGLSDAEIREVDRWIRSHTARALRPVRRVEPIQVFELAFEGCRSPRVTRAASRRAFRASRAGARQAGRGSRYAAHV